jgi:CysZ protein
MLEDAAKALSQIFSPGFRRVLWKSIGFALVLIAIIGIALNRVFSWLAAGGAAWVEANAGHHTVWQLLASVLSVAATLGIVTGAVFLMPAVTAFVGSFFVDEIADEVERQHYPADPLGRALPISLALIEGIKTALLAVMVYVVAVPFLLFAGIGFVIMFVLTAYLLSREYFLLAAMRFRPPAEAKAIRRARRGSVFAAGLPIALFVSVPILNLATPLFAMAMMVHVHKRLSGRRAELITD